MKQSFINKIEELRRNTYSRITEVQRDTCPMIKKIYLNYQFEYWYDGYKHNLWEDHTHIYAVNELPYCYDNELKNTTFMETLDVLIEQDKMFPFLMFVEGAVIPWSKITIIHDYDYTYLRIDDIYPDHSFYADIVVFPIPRGKIRYGEDNDIIINPNRKGFYFDRGGYRIEDTTFADIGVRLEILDDNIYYKEVKIDDIVDDTIEFTDLPDGFVPTVDNILLFNEFGIFNHERDLEIEDIYNGAYGMIHIKNKMSKWAILLYNTNANKSASHLYDRLEDLDKKRIKKLLKETDMIEDQELWNDIVVPLVRTFDFDHTFGDTYENNLSKAAEYITNYDYRILRDAYRDGCNIKSLTYSGKEFKDLADDKGYVHYSRRHSELIEDVVVMFVNHKLYEYSIDIYYTTNTVHVPIFGILDNDNVEVLIFTQCNNNILDITIEDNTTPVYIHPEYNLDDCHFMSEECFSNPYTVPLSDEGRRQYIVDLKYTKNDDDTYLIKFTDANYYGKPLKVVPKKQFRYYRFKQKAGQFKIVLPTQFNYCHNADQYMVFVNSKKIDRTEYTITIMNENRPFDKLILYMATILDEGDYVDIFYLPELLVEKYREEAITSTGLLLLDDTDDKKNYPTTYPLSKYTAMVFVNGCKVNPLDIKDVSLNCMIMNMDKYNRDENGDIIIDGEGQQSTNNHQVRGINNITIVEFVSGEEEFAGYLQNYSDAWKTMIKTVLDKYNTLGLQMIFGNMYNNDNPDPDYKDNFADLKSILYDIVLDYYIGRNEVDTGIEFPYDFERQAWEPYVEPDTMEIRKLIDVFPDRNKLLDYEILEDSAREEDVMEGQKFLTID